jgi:Family of unknown function (DUF6286)
VSETAGRSGTQMLPAGARLAPQGRAAEWSRRGARRRARRVFRPRRSVASVIVAAVIAAAGLLGVIEAVSAALGHPLWRVPHRYFAGPLRDTPWSDVVTLAIAAAVAFIGLVLVLAALIPGRPRAIPVASGDTSVVVGVPRASLRRAVARAAQDVDGIDRARVKLRGRRITVRAATRLRDTTGLRGSVHAAVQDRLTALDPLWPMRIRVRIRRKAG